MKHVILIDGYNLLNETVPLGELKGDDWADARDKLVAAIADYQGYRQEKIYLIFDGHFLPENPGKEEKFGRLSVVFTKKGESADSWIERKAVELSQSVHLTVVTSDRLEQDFVWNQGALRRSARELWVEIEGILRKRERNEKKDDGKFSSLDERLDEKTRQMLEKWRRSC